MGGAGGHPIVRERRVQRGYGKNEMTRKIAA